MPININYLRQTLQRMKNEYEAAIFNGTHINLIRSKKLINKLHEFVVKELKKNINESWIIPDKKVYGFPKKKEQDILVQPPQDAARVASAGPILAINIRSQLSSIEKNYDTLFERVFAEALNLHNRFPYMVLGYIYLLPKIGYDPEAAKNRRVELSERYDLEKYIISFLSISGRESADQISWKYERICLLIVDFEKNPPKIMDNMNELVNEGLVNIKFSKSFSFENLRIMNFFDEIYKKVMERYYLLIK